jgi:hypothetical protein
MSLRFVLLKVQECVSNLAVLLILMTNVVSDTNVYCNTNVNFVMKVDCKTDVDCCKNIDCDTANVAHSPWMFVNCNTNINFSNFLFLEKERIYSSKFFAVESGRAWSYLLGSAVEINLPAGLLQFFSFPVSLPKESKLALDEHAGVDVAQSYPEGKDLKTRKMSNKIGGSAVHAIDQYLSSLSTKH